MTARRQVEITSAEWMGLLSGRRTQLRRPLDPQPPATHVAGEPVWDVPADRWGRLFRLPSSMLDDLCLVFWCPFGRPGELIQLNPPDPEDKPVVYRIRDIRIERLFSISGPDIIHSGCPQSELNGGRPKYLAWFRRQWEEAWGEDSWADDLIWIAELGSPKKLEKRG